MATEGGQRQQSQHPNREAPTDAGMSDDARMSVSETQRLQAEAQARINARRAPNQIGAQP